jgi:hypothetical protein
LQLPEEFVRDLIENYYQEVKVGMYEYSHVEFIIHGLGRFLIRPLKFFKRESTVIDLINRFDSRRDNRGIMIKKELEQRFDKMRNIKSEVQKLYEQHNAHKK